MVHNVYARKHSSKTEVFVQNVIIIMHVSNVLTQRNVKNVILSIIGPLSLLIKNVYVTKLIIRMIRINVCYVKLQDVISARNQILVNLVQRKKGLNLMLLPINVHVRLVNI